MFLGEKTHGIVKTGTLTRFLFPNDSLKQKNPAFLFLFFYSGLISLSGKNQLNLWWFERLFLICLWLTCNVPFLFPFCKK